MKVSSRRFLKHAPGFFFFFLLSASAVVSQAQESPSAQQARALWEQAIAAKGGREQLKQVNSLLVSYRETTRNWLGVPVHRGIVERLYVFPDKSWGWDDGLPPPFRLTVGFLNLERNLRCEVNPPPATLRCRPAKQGSMRPDEGLTHVQYLYLMETRWVKPTPFDLTMGRIGFKKVDVVHTRFENKRIDYFLDRKTHLPLRVEQFYGDNVRATYAIDLSEYVNISSVKMPGRQKRGKISFQINPPYDESIFTRMPSVEAGPHAWQQSNKPSR